MMSSGANESVISQAEPHALRQSRDTPTFEGLYRSHYGRMVVVARLMVQRLAPAEEIVQDAFLQLYRNWSQVEFPVTYLRLAVVDGCRSHGRRLARSRRQLPKDVEPAIIDGAALAVRDALLRLTPRQRAAIVLRYYEDLSERQIAEALGCRPGTVKSLLSRGLAQLRGEFDER